MSARPTHESLQRFIYDEARLLDTRRYDEWYELFADDGRYWVPLSSDQTDGKTEQSISYEDKLLLRVRVERLKSPKAYSLSPPVTCQHVLQAPTVERTDDAANHYSTRTPFMYAELKGDDQLVLFGTVSHHLRVTDDGLRIVLKRVDLLNAGAALPAIYLFP